MIINFHDWSLEEASSFTECFRIATERVKPFRDSITQQIHEVDFWKFWDKRPEGYAAIAKLPRVMARSRVGNRHCLAFLPVGIVYDSALVVFTVHGDDDFALLQCSIHEEWARFYAGAAMRTDMRYSTKACFDTFPYPTIPSSVASIGGQYYEFRSQIMSARQEGLTSTANRFHNRGEQSADIVRLRALHQEMDQAVTAAYGWSDLDLGHGFYATRRGERYTLSEPARCTVLARLLALNHQRHEEEVKAGLHDKKAGKIERAKSLSKETAAVPEHIQKELI
jgi:hypothetical protein